MNDSERFANQLNVLRDYRGRAAKTAIIWAVVVLVIGAAVYGLIQLGGGTAGNSGVAVDKVSDADHVKGPLNAPATLIEYSDLQCPACGAYYPIVKRLASEFGDKLLIVYRHFPLRQIHKHAAEAAQAAEAAALQGKFWAMHDKLFETQESWSSLGSVESTFVGYARDLGLDESKFKSDYASQAAKDRVSRDEQSGNAAKVNATPTFFLNGQKLANPRSYDEFKKLVDGAIKGAATTQTSSEKVHNHFDLRVVVEGKAIDFSATKFQKTKDNPLNEGIHFHDGNGEVVHIHKSGVTLNDLLTSFGLSLDRDCMTIEDGSTKCATGANKIRMLVNSQANAEFGTYRPKDLDRILVSYGSESEAEVANQREAVTDKACIYSEKCPERGKPPTEDCVGGLGTDCD